MSWNDPETVKQPSRISRFFVNLLAGTLLIGCAVTATAKGMGVQVESWGGQNGTVYHIKANQREYWVHYGTKPSSVLPQSVEGCKVKVTSKVGPPPRQVITITIPKHEEQSTRGRIHLAERTFQVYQQAPYKETGQYHCRMLVGRHNLKLSTGWNTIKAKTYSYATGAKYVEVETNP